MIMSKETNFALEGRIQRREKHCNIILPLSLSMHILDPHFSTTRILNVQGYGRTRSTDRCG
jgi:hypothetical protein